MSTAAAQAAVEPAAAVTLTEGLVGLIRAKSVAQSDLDAMALIVLDGVANMLAGCVTEPGAILRGWGADKPGICQALGSEPFWSRETLRNWGISLGK